MANHSGHPQRIAPIDERMKKILTIACLALAAIVNGEGYKERGRSMVITTGGIVASEHPLASQAAAQILAEGGNAIDAAITANACMGVLSLPCNAELAAIFSRLFTKRNPEKFTG